MSARFACPCCGFLTLDEEPPGTSDICLVCFWEDDNLQSRDPNLTSGANLVCLAEARENYKAFGASEKRFLGDVRAPRPEEVPPAAAG